MPASSVPVKTADGVAELNLRQRRLSQRHRTLLLFIDGRRDEREVRHMAERAGVPDGVFDELLLLGMIEFVTRPTDLDDEREDGLLAPLSFDDANNDFHSTGLPSAQGLLTDLGTSELDDRFASEPAAFDRIDGEDPADMAFEEARVLLIRAVRSAAPVAGSLTLLRLRRATNRAELAALLGEVHQRITRPARELAAQQTIRRARVLLDLPYNAPVPSIGV